MCDDGFRGLCFNVKIVAQRKVSDVNESKFKLDCLVLSRLYEKRVIERLMYRQSVRSVGRVQLLCMCRHRLVVRIVLFQRQS